MNIITEYCENDNETKTEGMFHLDSTLGGLDEPLGMYKEVTEQFFSKPLIYKASEASKKSNSMFDKGVFDRVWVLNKSRNMFAMKRAVVNALWRNTAKEEFWSVKNCLTGAGNTELRRNENGAVLFSNVNLCKSPHICPYCSYRISVRRSIEVAQVVAWAYRNSYVPCLITFTHQHSNIMLPSTCINIQQKALQYFYSGTWAGRKLKKMSIGRITGSEILHGVNGCHFHSHILFFMKSDYKIDKQKIADSWVKALKAEKGGNLKSGSVKNMLKNSVDIMENCHTGEYIAKWGVEKELTCSHSKSSEGTSIFSLAMNGQEGLFVKYARALKGRSRIKFSPGLRAKAGLKEKKSDWELMQEEINESQLIAIISREIWHWLLQKNLVGDCKFIAENYGYKGLETWFDKLGLPCALSDGRI